MIGRHLVLAGAEVGETVVRAEIEHPGYRFLNLEGTEKARLENASVSRLQRRQRRPRHGVRRQLRGLHVEMANNQAGNYGGALHFDSTQAHLENVTFTDNRAESRGGAIYGVGGGAQITVLKSTATNNVSGYGAFAHVDGNPEIGSALMIIVNSTMTQNVSTARAPWPPRVGASTSPTPRSRTTSTSPILGTSARGGIFLYEPPSSLVIANTIVAANLSKNGLCNCRAPPRRRIRRLEGRQPVQRRRSRMRGRSSPGRTT